MYNKMSTEEDMFSYAIIGCFVFIVIYLYFSVDKIDENEELLTEKNEKSHVHCREVELTHRIKKRMQEKYVNI